MLLLKFFSIRSLPRWSLTENQQNSKLQKLPTIGSHQKFDYICNAQAVNSVLLEKKDQGGLKRVNVSNGNSASRILDRGGLILRSPRLISLPKKTFPRGTVCGGPPWEEISGMKNSVL